MVIRTRQKASTLIEVCTDFSSLVTPTHLHRPAEQTCAVHQQTESYTEEDGDLEDVFAVGDRPPWTNRRSPEPATSATLQQMFALAHQMGYEMHPIARQPDAQRQPTVFAHRHVPAGITRGSNVSVVENLVTCRPAAHDWTLRFPSSRHFNLIIGRNAMETTTRETLRRPGPHPHRYIRTSFDRPPCHLHASHRLQLLIHRILRSYLLNYIRFHVQKHARQPLFGIVRNHRRCPHRTLFRLLIVH